MMKFSRTWLLTGLLSLVLLVGVSDAAVRQIIGASVDKGPLRPPSGVCSGGSFVMASDGILSFTEATTIQLFDIAPLESSFEGNGYFLTNTAANVNNLYRINLETFTVAGTTVTDTANNPDNTNTQAASHYNTFATQWVQSGIQVIAPCNVAVNDCLHVRTYNVGTLIADIRPGIGQIIGSGVTNATFDSSHTFYSYVQTSGVAGVYLGRFTTGVYGFVDSVLTDVAAQFGGIANDTSFVYGTFLPSSVYRYAKSSLGSGPTIFTPGLTGGVGQIRYDSVNNVFYVAAATGATNRVFRLNGTTLAITGTLVLGATEAPRDVLIDAVNDKLYIGVLVGGVAGALYRVNRTTFVQEATFSTDSTPNGAQYFRIDVPHQKAYIAFAGGGGEVSQIQKVDLCS